ncbi:MAG: hypothetical protein HUU16_11230 [Candidatus Omnitrophica bacterium]|nr:hypothetical protein [bacterium]NUN96734.1 hypothetical protein [Candidatus Omnitrophota bacterium]
MAICAVCGEMFDNTTGFCPSCGAEYKMETGGRSAESLFAEAMQRIQAGQVIDAKGLLTQLIKLDEGNASYRFYLGSVHYKLGEYEAAYNAWQRADRLMPNNDRILKGLVAARQKMAEAELKKKNA